MKIAVPLANGRLSMHFGHCEEFALVEVDEATKEIRGTELLTPPAHEPGVLPRWLHEQGATIIIAGGMGKRAHDLFTEKGIIVITGASGLVSQVLNDFVNDRLTTGTNVCDH